MAPLIAQLIRDSQRSSTAGLRKLLVRIALELLRMEYMLVQFMNKVGVEWGTLTTWREDGWRSAVKELKTAGGTDDPEAGSSA